MMRALLESFLIVAKNHQKGQNANFFPHARWRHVRRNSVHVAPPCEWILQTLPQTVRSTEDHVATVTLLVLLAHLKNKCNRNDYNPTGPGKAMEKNIYTGFAKSKAIPTIG